MSIINILYKTAILLACSIIQVFGVLFEGTGKVFEQLGKYLCDAHDKLLDQLEKKAVKKTTISATR